MTRARAWCRAVERAAHAQAIADAVLDQVKEQAVYALLTEGLSIRAIAERARLE